MTYDADDLEDDLLWAAVFRAPLWWFLILLIVGGLVAYANHEDTPPPKTPHPQVISS